MISNLSWPAAFLDLNRHKSKHIFDMFCNFYIMGWKLNSLAAKTVIIVCVTVSTFDLIGRSRTWTATFQQQTVSSDKEAELLILTSSQTVLLFFNVSQLRGPDMNHKVHIIDATPPQPTLCLVCQMTGANCVSRGPATPLLSHITSTSPHPLSTEL